MTSSPSSAVLFDIDGTLVDTNYAHVDAWSRAFAAVGHPVDAWRIHRSIGKDSALLLGDLLGDAADTIGDRAKELHTSFYGEHSETHVFDGAKELLKTLADRGLAVVLATSAPQSELEGLRAKLDIENALWAVTSSEDVEQAKPEPGIVEVALERAGVDASEAVFVGDAVWDVEAAKKAGVRCIGVLSGGMSRGELEDAGAVSVFSDVAALLEGLDESPIGDLRA